MSSVFTNDRDGNRPRLLVSVRDVAEAEAVLRGGADVVDVKEPSRGALGRADATTVDAIAALVRRTSPSTPTSAALGELTEWSPSERLPELPKLVKIGLAGIGRDSDWPVRLSTWSEAIAACGRSWVGVVYADWRVCGAPSPDEIVDTCLERDAAGILVDTYGKEAGSLLEWIGFGELRTLGERTRDAGRFLALAGRLAIPDLDRVVPLEPDVVAIRSAACRDADRRSVVDEHAVRAFRAALQSSFVGAR